MKKNSVVFLVLTLAFLLSGCAKVPQTEIDAARAAIEKAKQAQADVYMETEYAALTDSMNVINAEIETNKGKLFKGFSDVKTKLAAVESRADKLVGDTQARKDTIKEEVNTTLVNLQALANENNALVEKAPRGKEGKAAIDAIKSELAVIDTTAAQLSGLLKNGDLLTAQTKAKTAYSKAVSLNTELKTVIEKYKQKQK